MKYSLLCLFWMGCDPDPKPDQEPDLSNLNTGSLESCISLFDDPYTLEDVYVQEQSLTVSVTYTGGCEEHGWELCWDGSIAESMPLQVSFSLGHYAYDDSCEMSVSEEISFDISSLEVDGQPTTIYLGDKSVVINQEE